MSFGHMRKNLEQKKEKDKRAGGKAHEAGRRRNVKNKKAIERERMWVDLIHAYHMQI